MRKKFILKNDKRYVAVDNNPTIRVSASTYNILVELANKSGLSMSKVANCAILFAYKNYSESEDE